MSFKRHSMGNLIGYHLTADWSKSREKSTNDTLKTLGGSTSWTLPYVFALVQGVPTKNGTRVNGYRTVPISSNQLIFSERGVKSLNDRHTKNQVNQLNISVQGQVIEWQTHTKSSQSVKYKCDLRLIRNRVMFGELVQIAHNVSGAERTILYSSVCVCA